MYENVSILGKTDSSEVYPSVFRFSYFLLTASCFIFLGHSREAIKEVDTSFNGTERASVSQRLPKLDSYPANIVGPKSDYRQPPEQPAAPQRSEISPPVIESAVKTPPQSVSSQLSTPPAAVSTSTTKASTPPRVSTVPAVSESPTSAPRNPSAPLPALAQISTPPLMMLGPKLPTSAAADVSPAGSKHLLAGSSSSSLAASPPKLTATPTVADMSTPAPVSSESDAYQSKPSLPPAASGPPKPASPPALVPTSSYSMSAPISSLQRMVQGSKPPLLTPCFTDKYGGQHEKPGPPKLLSTSLIREKSLVPGPPVPPVPPVLSSSASPMFMSKPPPVSSNHPVAPSQHQTDTPLPANSDLPAASAASQPPATVNLPSTQESPKIRPLSTLPLLTTQASRTAPMSGPPALVSVLSATGMPSGAARSTGTELPPPDTTAPHRLATPKPEYRGHSDDTKAARRNGKPEEHQLDSGKMGLTEKVESAETTKPEILTPKSPPDLGKPTQTPVLVPVQKPQSEKMEPEQHQVKNLVTYESEEEQTPPRKSEHTPIARAESAEEESFEDSSQCDDSRIHRLEESSREEDENLCTDDSAHFDSSFQKDTSQLDDTSQGEEEPSTAFDTTRDSSSSEGDSRDDTLDSTMEGETSEAKETKDSSEIPEDSMLDSSLNNSSKMEEASVDRDDESNVFPFVSPQPGQQGTFLQILISESRKSQKLVSLFGFQKTYMVLSLVCIAMKFDVFLSS